MTNKEINGILAQARVMDVQRESFEHSRRERWVVAEMGTSDHGDPVPLRVWASDKVSRIDALREIAALHPGCALKVVDGPGMP